MERETRRDPIKLTVVAGIDYPEATEILVSFPDRWEYVHHLQREASPLYVGAMPAEPERPRQDRFYGLPAELNESLASYRLYKLFQPWPMPRLNVQWDEASGGGRVTGMSGLKVQLREIGQAQIWHGDREAVLWECYMSEQARKDNWQDELAEFWRAVERSVGVGRYFALPHEPTFKEGYAAFLKRLGYAPAPRQPRWWRKRLRTETD